MSHREREQRVERNRNERTDTERPRNERTERENESRLDRNRTEPRDRILPKERRNGNREQPPKEVFKVDREKTCPLLLRVFTKMGGHHSPEDFRGTPPLAVEGDELQIYTWKDATLREITNLIKEVRRAARAREARLTFSFVYPDSNGRYVMREVGSLHSTRPGKDDNKTLHELRFQTGDFLDVAIYVK
eukprot:TRINITY_DN5363_c0_g1_i1.p1 TRINITY_DN5363_c0_g1~~TRINITY_DN5363_c0_g1_i1.p1  ORF type:complete len:189 (-),score=31.46 TRINITY_DN5363_c0_g1_i1:9-575(-)